MLTRRSLLRLFGIGGAAAVVAPSVLTAPAEVKPKEWNRNELTVRMEPPPQFVAPGAFCAPMTPYYDLASTNATRRPVLNSLPQFAVPRGGVRMHQPPPD